MEIKQQELQRQLSQQVLPIYVVHGDEPLQQGEICDSIRSHLRSQAYEERQVFHVDKNFDWNQLSAAASELSLFSARRILELRLPGAKPGDMGSRALQEYAQRPAEDTVMLLISGKLDKKSKWFKALDSVGANIAVWPVASAQLPAWLLKRFQSKRLQVTQEAVQILSDRSEGNLLAAAQEVEKIALIHEGKTVDAEMVLESVADSARYDIYSLVDAALQGEQCRVSRMLYGLKAEGMEPVLILWAISREVRQMTALSQEVERGVSVQSAMAKARVWPKRKTLVAAALRRHNSVQWMRLLQQASRIDRMVKGMQTGNVWDELIQLLLFIAGLPTIRFNPRTV